MAATDPIAALRYAVAAAVASGDAAVADAELTAVEGEFTRLRLSAAADQAPLRGVAVVQALACPRCGDVSLRREEHRRNSVIRYWRCRACGDRFKLPARQGGRRAYLAHDFLCASLPALTRDQ
jgi:predicted RNA-binding Zn-ribbon protein involved in translation (DUF1610 family)